MNFKTVSIVKFPVDLTWQTMLHHLPDIAKDVDDLESINEIERTSQTADTIKVVSVWCAKPNLPEMVTKYIKPDMLKWDDIALWKEKEKVIDWEIRSHHYSEELQCGGTTAFEPAMGGKGCKLTFSGALEFKGNLFSGMGVLDSPIAKIAETVLGQMIPSNFRKITEALGRYVEKNEK